MYGLIFLLLVTQAHYVRPDLMLALISLQLVAVIGQRWRICLQTQRFISGCLFNLHQSLTTTEPVTAERDWLVLISNFFYVTFCELLLYAPCLSSLYAWPCHTSFYFIIWNGIFHGEFLSRDGQSLGMYMGDSKDYKRPHSASGWHRRSCGS